MPKLHLRFAGLHQRSLSAYVRALRDFFFYLRAEVGGMPSSFAQLDHWLGEYINHCYQEGDPIAYAGHTLSALSRFLPACRDKLPISRSYYRNWNRVVSRERAIPMPWEFARGMAAAAWLVGDEGFSCSILLGFALFLRTSEIILLKWGDIKCFSDKGVIVVALRNTKTSRSKAAYESVAIKDPVLCSFIAAVKKAKGRTMLFSVVRPSTSVLSLRVFVST
jgi:hypothetical protein